MLEKLKQRTIWLADSDSHSDILESAAALLRDVKGVIRVRIKTPDKLVVSYNVRQITLQTITALLEEFGYTMRTSLFCRLMRSMCYYIEDIECNESKHDQAEYTRDAFINRYLTREHGCRDHRPDYLRRYL
ncbi:MAG: hypothetical protein OEY45_09775 [Gammaproteobacteria bacterium]|nr:hypothetical protein [Gammaproteobacteria bacterium]MDH5515436.1 hypothetical protein [Gammaproteobacteria bacterium]